MGSDEQRGTNRISCGYGILGLCCSACLFGPCRLTPFEDGPSRSLCERDRDGMAAQNLLDLTLREALDGIWKLREGIFTKPSHLEGSSLIREAEKMLSPWPKEGSSLLSDLFPERIFPGFGVLFGEKGFPPRSFMEVLFDAVEISRQSRTSVEELLDQALRVSLVALFSNDLRERMAEEADEARKTLNARALSAKIERLPAAAGPLILDWTDLEEVRPPFLSPSLRGQKEGLVRNLQERFPILSIEDGRSLLEVGRALFAKWRTSVADIEPLILISSRRVSSVLGALALGGTVVSFPPLPIHGSSRVEDHLSKGLKHRLGSVYRTPGQVEGLGEAERRKG